jgi:hypothetical protein
MAIILDTVDRLEFLQQRFWEQDSFRCEMWGTEIFHSNPLERASLYHRMVLMMEAEPVSEKMCWRKYKKMESVQNTTHGSLRIRI